MRLSVQASLRLNHAIHQGNHRLDRPLHISALSGNVCPVDDFAEATIVGITVPPGDIAADHAGLLGMAGVVGTVQGEVPQRGELRLDAVEPRGIGGHIGQLDVVGLCPLADPRVVTG
jgi:hypothetical protein